MTRSPIELFWTAKKENIAGCIRNETFSHSDALKCYIYLGSQMEVPTASLSLSMGRLGWPTKKKLSQGLPVLTKKAPNLPKVQKNNWDKFEGRKEAKFTHHMV